MDKWIQKWSQCSASGKLENNQVLEQIESGFRDSETDRI